MSELFICLSRERNIQTPAEAMQWTSSAAVWKGGANGIQWALSRPDDEVIWAPATDPVSGLVGLVAGRLAFDEEEWQAAERLPYEGGLAARLVIARWIREGASGVEALNGGAAVAILDSAQRSCHLWIDRAGFVPMFRWQGSEIVLSTHPDLLRKSAVEAGKRVELNLGAVAQMLRGGKPLHPETFWTGIEALDPGMRYRFELTSKGVRQSVNRYWRPAFRERPYIRSRAEVVERLEYALKNAVRRRTLGRFGQPMLLLSAGADSRVGLFGASEPSSVQCVTLYDTEPNIELAGARSLASAAGAKHFALQRTNNYYLRYAGQSIQLSAGMGSVESSHFTGLPALWPDPLPESILSGCYADYLLKGIALDSEHVRLFGRALPLMKFSDYRTQWHHPHFSLTQPWESHAIEEILERQHRDVDFKSLSGRSEVEFRRISPIGLEPDVCGRASLRRLGGYDPYLADNEIVEIAWEMDPAQKLNGIAFGQAVDRICGPAARKVGNANYSAPVGASEWGRASAFLRASLHRKARIAFGKLKLCDQVGIQQPSGSWPQWPKLIMQFPELYDWTRQPLSGANAVLEEMLGRDRLARETSAWASREPALLVRAFTLYTWFRIVGLS